MTRDPNRDRFISALRFDWLTPLYDPLVRWTLRESAFKSRLIEQAQVERGHRVLDLGCGTGTLTLLLKKTHPDAEVAGLDGDPKALEIGRNKAARAGVQVVFDQGMCFDLPYPDHSFDLVLSSLLFHHLSRENKLRTLHEVFRILLPGGQLHVADWGRPQNPFMRLAFLAVQVLDGFATTADNVNGLLPKLCRSVGFEAVDECAQFMTVFGTLSLHSARNPGLPVNVPEASRPSS